MITAAREAAGHAAGGRRPATGQRRAGYLWRTSTAPMSQAGPNGRDRPRWSVRGQPVDRAPPWLIAGLPRAGISVIVGPPFAASLPSLGPVLVRSVDLANPHVVPLSRLYPTVSAGAAPAQLPPEVDPAT